MKHEACIVSVGEELLSGDTVDRNAPEIAAALRSCGVRVRSIRTVGDSVAAIAGAVHDGLVHARGGVVVVSGGLGPTADDVTREGVAQAAGQPLVRDADALAMVRAWFAGGGRPMPISNERQALRPSGATLLANGCGTAPGLELRLGDAVLFVLPGVPAEMRCMLREHVLPRLQETLAAPQPLARIRVRAHGIAESLAGERIAHLMGENHVPMVGITVSSGILTITVTGGELSAVNQVAQDVEERLGEHVFGRDEDTLESVVLQGLERAGFRLAVAESCTGGLICRLLTGVPGASRCFLEGAITYSNGAKIRRLAVDAELLERCGAVSSKVARAMVEGMARTSGAQVAVSTTGIAGPGGATADKPKGLVFLGLCVKGRSLTRRLELSGDRAMIQLRAARGALDLVRRGVDGTLAFDALV